jgi:hypothetical protein
MASFCKLNVVLGGIFFVLVVSSYLRPNFAFLILSGLVLAALVILLAIALVAGFLRWRQSSNLWPLAALVCIAAILCSCYFATSIARYMTDRAFEKNLADYARVADNFRNGSVICTSLCNGDPKVIEATTLPAHVRDIWGAHCDGGAVIVLFRVDTNVPLLHEG